MQPTPTTDARVTEPVKGVTNFGFGQIGQPTPNWATWTFRVVLYIASLGTIAIDTFTTMPDHTKVIVSSVCSFIVLATHSASKMFGITIPNN